MKINNPSKYASKKTFITRPYTSEVIVSNLTAEEIEYKLWCAVKPEYMKIHKKLQKRFVFTGIVQKYFFKMVRKNNITEKFSPLMIGKVEETSKGSIIFLRYFMSPNTTFLMLYFFISTSVIGLFFIDYDSILFALAIPLSMFLSSYALAILLFNYQFNKNGSIIKKILSTKSDIDF